VSREYSVGFLFAGARLVKLTGKVDNKQIEELILTRNTAYDTRNHAKNQFHLLMAIVLVQGLHATTRKAQKRLEVDLTGLGLG